MVQIRNYSSGQIVETIPPENLEHRTDITTQYQKDEDNLPRKVDKAFFRDQKLIPRVKSKLTKKPLPLQKELIEPLLFLMREDGYTDILEGVKSGEFVIGTKKTEKSIYLTPNKLTTLRYNNQYYKTWIAYENCMTPYPEDPLHNAEMFRKTTQKLAMNWRDRDEIKVWTAKTKFWIFLIGGIAVAVILIFSTDVGRDLVTNLISGKANAAPQTIVSPTVTKNLSSGIKVG